jgi:hypothetical protein
MVQAERAPTAGPEGARGTKCEARVLRACQLDLDRAIGAHVDVEIDFGHPGLRDTKPRFAGRKRRRALVPEGMVRLRETAQNKSPGVIRVRHQPAGGAHAPTKIGDERRASKGTRAEGRSFENRS